METKTSKDQALEPDKQNEVEEEDWSAYTKRTSEECSRIRSEVLDGFPGLLDEFINPSVKSVKKVV